MFLASNACVDLNEAVKFWQKMDRLHSADVRQALELFSTHPSDANRLALLRRALPLARENAEKRGCKDNQFQDKLDEILNCGSEIER